MRNRSKSKTNSNNEGVSGRQPEDLPATLARVEEKGLGPVKLKRGLLYFIPKDKLDNTSKLTSQDDQSPE